MRYFLLHRSFHRPVYRVEVRNFFLSRTVIFSREMYIQKIRVFRLNIINQIRKRRDAYYLRPPV